MTLMLHTIFFLTSVLFFGYTLLLNRRLRSLHKNRSILEKLIQSATDLFQKTHDNLHETKSLKQEMEELLKKGTALRQDLYFLIDRGESIADQLEKEVRRLRVPGRQDVDGQEIMIVEQPTSPFQKAVGGN